MTVRISPISEINQRANDTLIGELGLVDTIRFLSQFRAGSGDYAAERDHMFQNMTANDIIAQIKSRRTEGV
jgi:hypothetical protein